MITDNLSATKGTTQSSAIIWLSLDPSLSMSGVPRHHPIANLWYLSLTPDNQSGRYIGTFSCLQHLSPRLSIHSISSFYTLQTFTIIIIIIIMQNYNFITFIILHCVYCNLVEYCNIVYCGTLCELYYNLCEHFKEQQINLVHQL